jgi:hypothetical protein
MSVPAVKFSPDCLPILIGSLPLSNHDEAVALILQYTPQIPLWPQLPKHPKEGMVRQFFSGFPGLREQGKRFWVDDESEDFPAQMAGFYDYYLRSEELERLPDDSLLGLDRDCARGFFVFTERLASAPSVPLTLKGQVTGPVTTGIGIKNRSGLPIIYDDNLRDILVKLLAGKARWQVEQLMALCGAAPPIIFIDEPGMVNFGSTAFSGISKELVLGSVSTLIDAVHRAGGLCGIHICANGDWAPALNSAADIISFDAYSYFNNFILFREQLVPYLERGGILAWGIVPTSNPETISAEQVDSLYEKWCGQLDTLCSLGFSEEQILGRTLIAPACGTGSLSIELARKVLDLTRSLSDRIRAHYSR